jgi:hypothetical protein
MGRQQSAGTVKVRGGITVSHVEVAAGCYPFVNHVRHHLIG